MNLDVYLKPHLWKKPNDRGLRSKIIGIKMREKDYEVIKQISIEKKVSVASIVRELVENLLHNKD